MTEQAKTKGKKSWKSWFVEEVESAPAAPPSPASLPVPMAIPGRPASAVNPVAEKPPAVPPMVDPGMVKRILSDLETSAPSGYKDFVADLGTLADTLPTEDLLYKSALRLASKQGHTPAGLALDYEKCLRLLDEQGRLFDVSVQEQTTARIDGRQAEVSRLDGEIKKLNEQLAQLQGQRNSEAEAIETDAAQIAATNIKFQTALAAVKAQLNDQKNKLATFGNG